MSGGMRLGRLIMMLLLSIQFFIDFVNNYITNPKPDGV